MTDNTKPAYFVFAGTADLGNMDPEYVKAATPAAIKANAMVIAGGEVGSQVKVLEGELPPGATFLVVEKFPSMAALEEFYYSKEYQSSIPLRADTVKMNFIAAVEGLSEAESQAQREANIAIMNS